MSTRLGKVPGNPLGEKSSQEKNRFGHAVHKAGTHSVAEHDAAEKVAAAGKRPAYKAPSALPKKGGA